MSKIIEFMDTIIGNKKIRGRYEKLIMDKRFTDEEFANRLKVWQGDWRKLEERKCYNKIFTEIENIRGLKMVAETMKFTIYSGEIDDVKVEYYRSNDSMSISDVAILTKDGISVSIVSGSVMLDIEVM